jgi:hypothetical protein
LRSVMSCLFSEPVCTAPRTEPQVFITATSNLRSRIKDYGAKLPAAKPPHNP